MVFWIIFWYFCLCSCSWWARRPWDRAWKQWKRSMFRATESASRTEEQPKSYTPPSLVKLTTTSQLQRTVLTPTNCFESALYSESAAKSRAVCCVHHFSLTFLIVLGAVITKCQANCRVAASRTHSVSVWFSRTHSFRKILPTSAKPVTGARHFSPSSVYFDWF